MMIDLPPNDPMWYQETTTTVDPIVEALRRIDRRLEGLDHRLDRLHARKTEPFVIFFIVQLLIFAISALLLWAR